MKISISLFFFLLFTGCASNQYRLKELKLGMNVDEARLKIGYFAHEEEIKKDDKTFFKYKDALLRFDKNNELEGIKAYSDIYNSPDTYHNIILDSVEAYKLKDHQKNSISFVDFSEHEVNKKSNTGIIYLSFKERILNHLKTIGYRITNNKTEATDIILLKLGVSSPIKDTRVESDPVYQVNYNSPQTMTTNYANSFGQNIGSAQTTVGNPYGTYSVDYAGQSMRTVTDVSYLRILEISSFKKDSILREDVNWFVTVTSSGSSDNLSEILPFLYYGASLGIDKNANLKRFSLGFYNTDVLKVNGMALPELTEQEKLERKNKESRKPASGSESEVKYKK